MGKKENVLKRGIHKIHEVKSIYKRKLEKMENKNIVKTLHASSHGKDVITDDVRNVVVGGVKNYYLQSIRTEMQGTSKLIIHIVEKKG